MNHFPPEITAYKPICLCGKGAYGQVWLVKDFIDNRRALKIVSKSALGNNWERELKGLQNYQAKVRVHPNLVQVYHIENCEDFFFYTMEAADNIGDDKNYIPSTLTNWIKKWNTIGPESTVEIFEALLDAVEYLHTVGVIHRDIKPDNIIFVNHVPKLSDIGLTASLDISLSIAGTQAFVPPEFLSGERQISSNNYHEVDVYALGKTLYCAFSGQPSEAFPYITSEILINPDNKVLNRTIKAVCHPRSNIRVKDIEGFRQLLHRHGNKLFYIRSFTEFFIKILQAPYTLLIIIWRRDLSRNFLILFALIGIVCFSAYVVFHDSSDKIDSVLADNKARLPLPPVHTEKEILPIVTNIQQVENINDIPKSKENKEEIPQGAPEKLNIIDTKSDKNNSAEKAEITKVVPNTDSDMNNSAEKAEIVNVTPKIEEPSDLNKDLNIRPENAEDLNEHIRAKVEKENPVSALSDKSLSFPPRIKDESNEPKVTIKATTIREKMVENALNSPTGKLAVSNFKQGDYDDSPMQSGDTLSPYQLDQAQELVAKAINGRKAARDALPRKVKPEEVLIHQYRHHETDDPHYVFQIKDLECSGSVRITQYGPMTMTSFNPIVIRGKTIISKKK